VYDGSEAGEGEMSEEELGDMKEPDFDELEVREKGGTIEKEDPNRADERTMERNQSALSIKSHAKERKESISDNPRKSIIASKSQLEEMNPVQKLEYWESQPDMIEVAKLHNGGSFGELALIEDKPRAATIKCHTDCTFATMEREDYNKTLMRIENRNINKIIDFFKDLPYFSSYGRTALGKIRFWFSRVKYKRSHVVYKEGDSSSHVYIVINGDFEFVRKIKHVENKEINYKRYITSNIFDDSRLGSHNAKSEVDSKVAQFTKNRFLSNNPEYNKDYRVALLCKGQMFGDQDTIYERPYQATVICRSNDGELYQITRENFQKLKNHGD
jgi:CRP-like cAMP-binding protein